MGARLRCVSDRAGPILARTLAEPRAPPRRGPGAGCRWPRAPGARRERVGAPVPRQVPGAPCRARAPPGSNPRADWSMIRAQAGAAKVSERRAGTLPASPSPALLWAASPPLPRPRQRPPSPGPGIHPPPHPLASPARFNCQPGTRRRPGPGRHPGWRPRRGYCRHPGSSCGVRRETKKPPSGFVAPPPPPGALPVARRCQGRGRRDLRNPPSQPTPTPCEPRL